MRLTPVALPGMRPRRKIGFGGLGHCKKRRSERGVGHASGTRLEVATDLRPRDTGYPKAGGEERGWLAPGRWDPFQLDLRSQRNPGLVPMIRKALCHLRAAPSPQPPTNSLGGVTHTDYAGTVARGTKYVASGLRVFGTCPLTERCHLTTQGGGNVGRAGPPDNSLPQTSPGGGGRYLPSNGTLRHAKLTRRG